MSSNAARDAGVRRVVLASSAAVYALRPDLPQAPPRPRPFQNREDMMPSVMWSSNRPVKLSPGFRVNLRAWRQTDGIVALRPFNVFGPFC